MNNRPQPARHSFRRRPGLLLSLLLAMILGCDRQEAESTAMPAEVLVAEVIQKDVPNYGEWESQVASLKSALNFADKRYRGGFASYLDVLSAQRDLFQAELSLVSTRQQHLSSIVRLYKALGGGWSPTEEKKQPASSPLEPGPTDHEIQSELKS